MSIGRNAPCSCGSGKKYKKCCLLKSPLEISQEMMKAMSGRESFRDEKGRLVGRPFISADFKGRKIRAVGNKVYPRPADESFHAFLIEHLKIVMGMEWGKNEQSKSKDEQHTIVQWIGELGQFLDENRIAENKVKKNLWAMEPSGNVQALLSFAYDVYNLEHIEGLPNKILRRLRDKSTFQSTKYEVTVASFFARAGYEIEWIFDKTKRRGEFIATHRDIGEKILVEAKSRHRSGILHELGEQKSKEELKAEVKGLYEKAKTQGTDPLPFMIFIDLNLPMTPEIPVFSKNWFEELKQMINSYPMPTKESPEVYNALFITNFSWHYYRDAKGSVPGENLIVIPLYAKYTVVNLASFDYLTESVRQYGQVPPEV